MSTPSPVERDLAREVQVRDLWVDGTIHFSAQSCRDVIVDTVWAACANGEFVNAIDYDHDLNRIGGVRCCRF